MLDQINYQYAQTVLCTGPFSTSFILYRCSCVPMKPALPLNHFFSCCMAIIRSDISEAVNRLRKHNNESFHHFYSLPPSSHTVSHSLSSAIHSTVQGPLSINYPECKTTEITALFLCTLLWNTEMGKIIQVSLPFGFIQHVYTQCAHTYVRCCCQRQPNIH